MKHQFNHKSYDAIIIGARCAGAATGMLLARMGARVLIVDREVEIRDTLSTHALMRPAVTLLDQWGLLDKVAVEDTPVVRNTQFHYGSDRVDVPIKPAGSAEGLYAPRRWLLDWVLGDAAAAAGAELRTGTRLVSLLNDVTGRVSGAILRHPDGTTQSVLADMVIGADGRQSMVAQAVNAKVIARSQHRSATVYTYVDGLENEGYRWYFGDQISAGLIPTTDGAHCLFTSCRPEAFGTWFRKDAFAGAMNILSHWAPGIADDLRARGPIERMRRFAGAPGVIRDCAGPGWALVGDAGYFKDPASAHGITDAFLDANRLAHALAHDPTNAARYQIERDHFAPQMFDVTQKIATLDWDMPTIRSLHMQLNACMKVEQDALLATPVAKAA